MGLLDSFYRVAEPAAGVVSGAAAEPIAGWAGLLGRDVQKTRNALTYDPRTQAGKEGQNALMQMLMAGKSALVDNNPPVRMAVDGFNSLADCAGGVNPLFGAALKAVPAAVGLLAGPGSQVSRNALANVVTDAGRSLAPNAEQMVRSYAAKTGIEQYILPPETFKALIEKKRSGEKLTYTERVMLENHQSDLMGDLNDAIRPAPQPPAPSR